LLHKIDSHHAATLSRPDGKKGGRSDVRDTSDLDFWGERAKCWCESKIAKENRPCKSQLSKPEAYGRSTTKWASWRSTPFLNLE
jgi:hypothetical protein